MLSICKNVFIDIAEARRVWYTIGVRDEAEAFVKNISVGKIAIGCALAWGIGYFASAPGLESGLTIFIWFLTPVLMAYAYGFAGMLPACVMTASMLIGVWQSFGAIWAACLFIVGILPAACMLALSIKHAPFFKQLQYSLGALAAGALGALVMLMALNGLDLAGAAANEARAWLRGMDAETIAEAEKLIMSALSRLRLTFDSADESLLFALVDTFEQIIKIYAPTIIVMYCALNATLGVLCVNYKRVRRGEDGVAYVPPNEWKLPASTVWGLVMAFVAAWIMSYMGRADFILAYYAIRLAAGFAFVVQACASILRRLKKTGMTRGKRTAIVVFLLLLVAPYLAPYGVLSALFGTYGALTPRVKAFLDKKRRDKEE